MLGTSIILIMVEAKRDGEYSPAGQYFSVDFFRASDVYGNNGAQLPNPPNQKFIHLALIPFSDQLADEERVAVIRSSSVSLTNRLQEVGTLKTKHPDVTEESLRRLLERFAESYLNFGKRPVADIVFDKKGSSYIHCQEPTCRFHQSNGCLNPKPRIFDDCPEDQWCMTYEPRGEEIND